MKEKMKSIKKSIHGFKELWKNKQIRSIIILGLYFVFFLIIIISLRTNQKGTTIKPETLKSSQFEFSIEKIKENNYHYLYDVVLNNQEIVYEGDRYQEKEVFTKNNTLQIESFYNYKEKYLKNINQVWSKVENPYLFSEFKKIENLEKILKESFLDAKTEYSNNKYTYTYKISTNNLVKIIEYKNMDIADIPNTIIVTTNSNKEVEKIQMDLSSYSYYKQMKNQKLILSITYSRFGEIEEIKDP